MEIFLADIIREVGGYPVDTVNVSLVLRRAKALGITGDSPLTFEQVESLCEDLDFNLILTGSEMRH